MSNNVKTLRLKSNTFEKKIAINRDLDQCNNINIFSISSLIDRDLIIVDTRKRLNQVDDKNTLKQEYIRRINPTINISYSDDNKIIIDISIEIKHYSKLFDLNWILLFKKICDTLQIPSHEIISL